MSTTDILIIVFMMLSFVIGLRDGLLKKLFAVIGVVVALLAATKYMKAGGEFIVAQLKFDAESAHIMAFTLIFITVIVLTNFFYRWFGGDSKNFKIWDRLAGGVVGMIEGLIVLSLTLILLNVYDFPSKEQKRESDFYKPVLDVAPSLFDQINKLFPNSKKFREEFEGAIEGFRKVEKGGEQSGGK